MNSESFDVIVIGGGPGGSTAATFLAMQGHRVLLLERDWFPRYQIGESLLPSTIDICHRLGVGPELDAAGFMPTNGGVCHWGSRGQPGWSFDFAELPSEQRFGRAWAYQVERSHFDRLLLNNASRRRVHVRVGHQVLALLHQDGRVVGVRYRAADGREGSARARFVIDAGGHSSPFHRFAGERTPANRFRNFALFGYFEGGKRLRGPAGGSTLNVSFENGWFWYTPLGDTLTSVGAVIDTQHAHLLEAGHEAAFAGLIRSCPMIADYLGGAKRVQGGDYAPLRMRQDWSYANTRFWAPGLALVGDAACHVDPLFSSGVHLATHSGALAATAIDAALRDPARETAAFAEFERSYRREYGAFYRYLTVFYETHRDKEDCFRTARVILGTQEPARQAFVRLVSGHASSPRLEAAAA